MRFSTRLLPILLTGWVIAACDPGPPSYETTDTVIFVGDAHHADVSRPTTDSDFPLRLGVWAADGEGFALFQDGQTLDIVHGTQGGIHVLTAFEVEPGGEAGPGDYLGVDDLAVDIEGTLVVDGAVAASTVLNHYWIGAVDHGVFRSSTLLIVFDIWDAPLWDGRPAVLHLDVTLPTTGESAGADCGVVLVDTGP